MSNHQSPINIIKWISLNSDELLEACIQARFQGSGPGGQKRNRVYSGIRLVHEASGYSVEADAHRESRRNLHDALHKLRLKLAISITFSSNETETIFEKSPIFQATPFRYPINPSHVDFPLFAMRAIYFLNKYQGQLSPTAQALGCSTSVLGRFLKTEKMIWFKTQEIRKANDLHCLK